MKDSKWVERPLNTSACDDGHVMAVIVCFFIYILFFLIFWIFLFDNGDGNICEEICIFPFCAIIL